MPNKPVERVYLEDLLDEEPDLGDGFAELNEGFAEEVNEDLENEKWFEEEMKKANVEYRLRGF